MEEDVELVLTQSRVGDRFEVRRLLGMGGMGSVYEAFDRTRDERVALKMLRFVEPESLIRFKKEFRALVDLAHPNLVALYELFAGDEIWFFTMELVDGLSLRDWLRAQAKSSFSPPSTLDAPTDAPTKTRTQQPGGAPSSRRAERMRPLESVACADTPRVRRVFADLARGLHALHSAGHVHRDVKPSNVMLTRDERVVVLDFGIVAELGAPPSRADSIVGTPTFMAPEQALGGDVTPASDWYAFGTILYDALAGRRPFLGSNTDVLAAKISDAAPSLSVVAPGVANDLAKLCDSLLAREPIARPDYTQIREQLDASTNESASLPPPGAGSAFDLVGRDAPLAEMREAYESAKNGGRETVLVHGPSGFGKTALADCFLTELDLSGDPPLILRARCYERETVPYKALDSLVDALCRELERRPSKEVDAIWPSDGEALLEVFPVLQQIVPRRSPPGAHEIKRRALVALGRLLVAAACGRVLVLFVDDMQWGDVDSVPFFAQLDAPSILVLGTYRSDHGDTSPFLRALRAARPVEIALGPLEKSDILVLASQVLAADTLSADTKEVGERIARECQGSPYFALELARHAVAQSAGAESASLHDVIRAREARLSADARELLAAIVIVGRPTARTLIEKVVGHVEARTKALNELLASSFVRSSATDVEPTHDAIREAVLARIPIERRRPIHLAFADALDEPHEKAFHLYSAFPDADANRVFAACRKAGELAAESEAFEQAFEHLERARTVAEKSGIDLDARFEQISGEAAVRTGRVSTGVPRFRQALQASTSPLARAQIHCGLAKVYNTQLASTAAREEIVVGLRELGLSEPSRSPVQIVVSLFALMHGMWLLRRRRSSPDAERLRWLETAVQALVQYGISSHFRLDALGRLQSLLRAFRFAAEIGPSRQLVGAYAILSLAAVVIGREARAFALVERARELASELKDPVATAAFAQYLGHVHNYAGQVTKAEVQLRKCLAEHGPVLENVDFLMATADLAGNLLMRAKAREGLRFIEEGLDRTAREGATILSEGHTYRCYAATMLALLGRPDEGREHLRQFEALESDRHGIGDRWRRAQWLAHNVLFAAEIGERGEDLERLIREFRALGIAPRRLPLQIRHFYVAETTVRLAEVDKKSPQTIERFRKARADLVEAAGTHASLCARLALLDAQFHAKVGDALRYAESAELAGRLGEETDSPLVAYELAVLRMKSAERAKDATREVKARAAAVEIAEREGWAPRIARLAI